MPARPNILWIITTQWRAQACGYAGDPNARTPRLDALAASARNFRQAVTPHPFGPFARAALLAGVPSPENGVRDYFDPLPTATRTIAHDLTARGYATAFFGKWHLAPRDSAAPLVGPAHAKMIVPPERRGGFGLWEGFEGGFQLNDPWLHGARLPEPTQFVGYQSDVVCERAAQWIAECSFRATDPQDRDPQGATRNWFCLVSLEPPHPPYAAPASGIAPAAPAQIILPANVPRGGEAEMRARRELAGYYAHIEATDRAIGRMLDGLPADTIVVVTSVHGDMHGAHGHFRKGWPHEESIRVPLLVRAGATGPSDALVSLLDLPRWALDWADGRQPETDAPLQQISMPSVVALPHQCDRRWRGVRTATRKLVLNDDGSPWLFFDLEADPGENDNLVGRPNRRAEIEALATRVRGG